MSARLMIKPRAGLKVRKPRSLRWLKPEGEEVQWSPFWQRRLNAGDVERVIKRKAKSSSVTTSAERPEPKESAS